MTTAERRARRKARELVRRVMARAPGSVGLLVAGPKTRDKTGSRTSEPFQHVEDVASDEGIIRAVPFVGTERWIDLEGKRTIRVVTRLEEVDGLGKRLAAAWVLPEVGPRMLDAVVTSVLGRGAAVIR